jgi:hypothetical protein
VSEGRGFFDTLTENLLMGWDSLNYLWYARVMSYTAQSQKQLFARLGLTLSTLKDWLALMGMVLVFVSVVTLLIVLRLGYRSRRAADPVVAGYRSLERKLDRVGLARLPHEGPKTLGTRIAALRPDLSSVLNPILHDYMDLRYGTPPDRADRLRLFRKRIRQFRPESFKEKK